MYTEEEIKKAFWKTFHKKGELLFWNTLDDEDNEQSTELYWDDFLDNLTGRRDGF